MSVCYRRAMSKHDQIVKAAGPLLEPGETIEIAVMAEVGQVSMKKQVATAAAVTVLTAGLFTAIVHPARRALVLTDRRLLILSVNTVTDRPQSELVAGLPRKELRARARKSPLNAAFGRSIYELTDAQGSGGVLRLTYRLPSRKLGAQLAAALGEAG